MSDLFKILFAGVMLILVNIVVLKVFPGLNINFNGLDMYILFFNVLFVLYIILPQKVGTIFNDLGNK
tara:strand:+ start:3133 stop:3333 length:201 start_codon:yes stop_codon:yes gene_type:complete